MDECKPLSAGGYCSGWKPCCEGFEVERCRLTTSNPALKAPTVPQRLKLKHDELLLNVVFKIKWRHYAQCDTAGRHSKRRCVESAPSVVPAADADDGNGGGDDDDDGVPGAGAPAAPAGVTTPSPDVATPSPDVATPSPDVATPSSPDIATPSSPDVATPSPDVTTPSSPDVTTPSPDVATPTPSPPTNTPTPITSNDIFEAAIFECLLETPADGLCPSSQYGPMPLWDTSLVTDMFRPFEDQPEFKVAFNVDISAWNTSAARTMSNMVRRCWLHRLKPTLKSPRSKRLKLQFDEPLSSVAFNFNLRRYNMFVGCSNFSQPIGRWDTSGVEDMSLMFQDATAFNQPIGGWDTARCEDMSNMFNGAAAFNQPLADWNTTAGRCRLTPS